MPSKNITISISTISRVNEKDASATHSSSREPGHTVFCIPSQAVSSSHTFHFYPQSIWFDQQQGNLDNDEITTESLYSSMLHDRPTIGRYVPDPKVEDYSNPKYKSPYKVYESPRSNTSPRSRIHSNHPHRHVRNPSTQRQPKKLNSEESNFLPAISLKTPDERASDPFGGISCNDADQRLPTMHNANMPIALNVTPLMTTYPVVKPFYTFSAASLFFPIHYGRPSVREKSDPRGLPQAINEQFHPNDRADMWLSSISLQKDNLNRMPLYKIGPGAVAFMVVISAFETSGMKYIKSNELFNVIWAKRATPYLLRSLKPYQKVNHFPGAWGLGRKDSLAMNVNAMKRQFGEGVFDIIPTSFLIPKQQAELERDAARHAEASEDQPVYIVKPCASSCGRGITLYKGIPCISEFSKEFVCQRYIGDPFLISGRKFDLRLYCVVTSFDPLRVYLFDEGLVRFAAMKYPGADRELDNINMHLTNYSINKTVELKHQTGDRGLESDDAIEVKWCVSDLKRYLAENHPHGSGAWEIVQSGCDDVIIKAFLSVENSIIERIRQTCSDKVGRNCFQLFGLDLLVDSALKVWLIEMNIMPSLATGSNLDKAVKSRMLAHMLTLIRIIPNRRNVSSNALCEDTNVSDTENLHIQRGAESTTPERIYKFGHQQRTNSCGKCVPLLRRFNDPNVQESMLTKEEVLMLVESEEEMRCAGGFRRIFPANNTLDIYLPLFSHGVRRNNFLLASADKKETQYIKQVRRWPIPS